MPQIPLKTVNACSQLHRILAVVALCVAACAPTLALAQAPERIDLVLTGRAIGPLPLRPGAGSEFELTVTNLGPRPVPSLVLATARWQYDWPRVNIVRQSPPCATGDDIGIGFIAYHLQVAFVGDIPVGGSRTCRFTLTTETPLYAGATLTFEAYEDGNFNQALDLNFSDNRVPLGIGPPLPAPASVPSLGLPALTLLSLSLVMIGLVVIRRFERSGRA